MGSSRLKILLYSLVTMTALAIMALPQKSVLALIY
jgi:hypothetical protein